MRRRRRMQECLGNFARDLTVNVQIRKGGITTVWGEISESSLGNQD